MFYFGMNLLPLCKNDFKPVVNATVPNTHGTSVENIVKVVTWRKMFVRES